MKERIIVALIVIQVLLSLFTGFRINGNFAFVGEYAFISFPHQMISSWRGHSEGLTLLQYLHWALLLISHLLMLMLPVMYYRNWSSKVLIYIPLLNLLMQFWLLNIFAVILVPFIIVWIISVILFKLPSTSYI